MSRLGKTSILIPKGVDVAVTGHAIYVNGHKRDLHHHLKNALDDFQD